MSVHPTPQRPIPQPPKTIKLHYSPETLGLANWQRIIRYYNNGIALADIVAKINAAVQFSDANLDSPSISLADCYMAIYYAMRLPNESTEPLKIPIKQRRKHLAFELDVVTFVKVYNAWRRHATHKKLMQFATSRLGANQLGIQRLIRSLNKRYRVIRQQHEIQTSLSAHQILQHCHQEVLAGRSALVIYLDEIPPGAIKLLDQSEEDQLVEAEDYEKVTEKFLLETPDEPPTPPNPGLPFGHRVRTINHHEAQELIRQQHKEIQQHRRDDEIFIEDLASEVPILTDSDSVKEPEVPEVIPEVVIPPQPPEPSVSEQLSDILG